ncbi:MAG: hypothetical protein M1444_02470 [Patescibacteria group bacterium]|nr:hypothetical protein [Patescibacteria group bacterium]
MNRIKHFFILAVDFIGLLIIVCILLIVLNYFEILSLSKTFPNTFGFLPQISKNVKKSIYAPTPAPTASIVWDKQAEPALVSNYSDYFKSHNIPISVYSENDNLFFVSGALTAYNKDHVQIITSQGVTVFKINTNSVFRKISPPTTSKSQGGGGENRITAMYKNSADFFSDAPFGSFVEIIYKLNGDLKTATVIDYYPKYKY